MSALPHWIRLAAASLAVGACDAPPSTQSGTIDVCRPSDMNPANFGIGELTVPHDQLAARLQADPLTDNYSVAIALSESYANALTQLTRETLNTPLPIAIDGEVLAEPVLRTPILDGRILISGNFTRSSAYDIVARLSRPCPGAQSPPDPSDAIAIELETDDTDAAPLVDDDAT